jgi:hypothetical protein
MLDVIEMVFWGVVILQLAAVIFMVVSLQKHVNAMRQTLLDIATVLGERIHSTNLSSRHRNDSESSKPPKSALSLAHPPKL